VRVYSTISQARIIYLKIEIEVSTHR
jgi:hypothetical protein